MIAVIACSIPPAIACIIIGCHCTPEARRRRLIREARQLVADLHDIRPHWKAEEHPNTFRVIHYDQMECVACMGTGFERFAVACRLCDGDGYLAAHHDDLTLAERRR